MRLTTVGTGTVSLTPGRVCAGHLVEAGDVRLLLDCGSGVVHRMAERGIDWWGITHVALTHFHADHIGDLPTLVFAFMYARRPGRTAPLVVVGPVGTRDLLARMAAAFGPWLTAPTFPLAVEEIAPDGALPLGEGVRIAARTVPHTPESVAYSVEHGGRRLVYTGDTGFDATLGEWARGCDLFLCECSLPERLAIPSHLTPEQCGALAELAQPRRLVLTHLYPPVEEVDILALVRARFAGDAVVATDGWSTED